ncbi:hypothetical protein BS47DRAFT_1398345 [Hydnum rufescens UP504]|uniref:Uncharacterized protein n=1 Tax=Hydnum rufescens UP504 TaxID=1448309 RepID=A0A9P6DRM3_9AGAM|nr:hypothetical protein BS47DRAFT_1398345 [Hydnum rufescens UP504]
MHLPQASVALERQITLDHTHVADPQSEDTGESRLAFFVRNIRFLVQSVPRARSIRRACGPSDAPVARLGAPAGFSLSLLLPTPIGVPPFICSLNARSPLILTFQIPLPPSTTSLLLESPESESPPRSNGTVTPITACGSLSARRNIGFTLSGTSHDTKSLPLLRINTAAANSLPQLSPVLGTSRFIEHCDSGLDSPRNNPKVSPYPRHENNINILSPLRSPPRTMSEKSPRSPSALPSSPVPPSPVRQPKTSLVGKVWRRASVILHRANTKNVRSVPPVPALPPSTKGTIEAESPMILEPARLPFPIRAATIPLPDSPVSPTPPCSVESSESPVSQDHPNDSVFLTSGPLSSLSISPSDSHLDMLSAPTEPSSPSTDTNCSSDSKSISTATSLYTHDSLLSPPPFDTLTPLRLPIPTSPRSPSSRSSVSPSRRKTIFRRSTSPTSRFSFFPKSPTEEISNEPPRSPMWVTLHSPGTIAVQTAGIEDDEIRRLSEAAFM